MVEDQGDRYVLLPLPPKPRYRWKAHKLKWHCAIIEAMLKEYTQ